MIIIPPAAADAILRDMLGMTTPQPLVVKLFTNDYVPDLFSSSASFIQPVGRGYSALTLQSAAWDETTTLDMGVVARHPLVTWSFLAGPPLVIHGYFVTTTTGALRWAERFEPVTVTLLGDTVSVAPNFTLGTGG